MITFSWPYRNITTPISPNIANRALCEHIQEQFIIRIELIAIYRNIIFEIARRNTLPTSYKTILNNSSTVIINIIKFVAAAIYFSKCLGI